MFLKTFFSISLVFALFLGMPSGLITSPASRSAALPQGVQPFALNTSELKVTAPDGAASEFIGTSVAISGDTALVGASGHYVDSILAGSVYVFVRDGSTWNLQQQLTASDGAAGDNFGWSVALSGDTALVGAFLADVSGNTDQGSAYIFTRSGTTWSQQARLIASDGAAEDLFGVSVALSGDTALVGAPYHDFGGNIDQGSAYVFARSGTTWSQQARLTASDGAAHDWFGTSVALSGSTALVGASGDDVSSNGNQGSAYVFVGSGISWSQQAKLTASDGAAGDWFGNSVSLTHTGDAALVGAPYADIGANVDQGAAYHFTRSWWTWSQHYKLTALDGAVRDYFGSSVALELYQALVGALGDDIGANVDQGSAYVFVPSGPAWSQQGQLVASDGAAGDEFGASVALMDNTAIFDNTAFVGAPFNKVGMHPSQGAAYFFQFHIITEDFADVPYTYWAYDWIERLFSEGITTGCSLTPHLYCPEDPVTRAQMAVFLERGINGPDYTPPAGTGMVFADVPLSYWVVDWIEKLYADGITSGCNTSPLLYCPDDSVTRAQMAKFLLKAKHGASYSPPDVGGSTGFSDVSTGYWAAAWIKQLALEGITSGCGGGNYCPDDSVTRAQMAKFLVLTFNLP